MFKSVLIRAIRQLRRRYWLEFILDSIAPAAFFLAMFFYYPFRQRFEFDPDEGSSAMMAFLLMRGFPLYTQIWSDHPPLFIYLLAGAFRLFGAHIEVGRVLVLLLSSLFLWVTWRFLRLTWGVPHALAGAASVVLLPYYTSLSVSAMIGLPAIAFAGLSMLALVAWHQRHQPGWLVVSAVLLALSVLTKFFTAFLAPIFIVGILLEEKSRARASLPWGRLARPAILWLIAFLIITGGLGLSLMGVKALSPLFTTHLLARGSALYNTNPVVQSVFIQLREAWPTLILGLVGGALALCARKGASLYPLAWAVAATLVLSFQVPVWYHHQLLITLPGAMLAGIAVGEATRGLVQQWRQRALTFTTPIYGVVLLSFLVISTVRARQVYLDFILPPHLIKPTAQPASREAELLNEMSKYAARVTWVVTDLPIFPFRLGLATPPPLANVSEKRLASGELREEQIIRYIREYKAEMVLLGRFKLPAVESAIRSDYKLVYTWGRKHLYLRRDLLRSP